MATPEPEKLDFGDSAARQPAADNPAKDELVAFLEALARAGVEGVTVYLNRREVAVNDVTASVVIPYATGQKIRFNKTPHGVFKVEVPAQGAALAKDVTPIANALRALRDLRVATEIVGN